MKTMQFGRGESLGLEGEDVLTLNQRIKRGLPYASLVHFSNFSRLPLVAIENAIGMPQGARSRRQKSGTLNFNESDSLCRLSRLYEFALELFHGEPEATQVWFQSPCRALGGLTPLWCSITDPGARELERVMGRML